MSRFFQSIVERLQIVFDPQALGTARNALQVAA